MKQEYDRHEMAAWDRLDKLGKGRGAWIHEDLPGSAYLYRYMPISGALKTFRTKSFLLRAPHKWDDPYEKWWCEQLFRSGSKLTDANAFGLCWTTRDKDEPMWRVYMCPAHPKVPSIRIRTTADKLCARMMRLAEVEIGKAFLGRVRYRKAAQLKEIAATLTTNPHDQLARNAARGLHWKRAQFQLEDEVRLLWIVTSPARAESFKLPFDHTDVIDQVMIGPSTGADERKAAHRQLVAAGTPKGILEYSSIYDPP